MKQFTMSQYATKEDLYKAKAEHIEKQPAPKPKKYGLSLLK